MLLHSIRAHNVIAHNSLALRIVANMARNDLGRLLMEQCTFDAFSKTQCIRSKAVQSKPCLAPVSGGASALMAQAQSLARMFEYIRGKAVSST